MIGILVVLLILDSSWYRTKAFCVSSHGRKPYEPITQVMSKCNQEHLKVDCFLPRKLRVITRQTSNLKPRRAQRCIFLSFRVTCSITSLFQQLRYSVPSSEGEIELVSVANDEAIWQGLHFVLHYATLTLAHRWWVPPFLPLLPSLF